MPYIKATNRKKFNEILEEVEANMPENSGELNYLITSILVICFNSSQQDYQTFNDFIGVLECAKLELYRRLVASYENKKESENGDVYNIYPCFSKGKKED
jgi:hypothetical protein